MHLRIKNGILCSFAGYPKYSGAPPIRIFLLRIYKYANDPADRLDTIQDHRLFLVALIVFTQSVGPN